MNTQKSQSIHKVNTEDAVALMKTSLQYGLKDAEVLKRQKEYGQNAITSESTSSLLGDIVKQLLNPLAIILLIAFALTIVLHEYIDAGVILVATIINVTISLYQERKAGDAFKALTEKKSHTAVVLRAGVEQVVPTESLVPGDIVFVKSGDYIPADARIIDSVRLSANQVMFTGESEAVSKSEELNDEQRPFDRSNMIFMGSVVITGTATAVVSATGFETEFGTIADKLSSIEKDTSPIQKNMKRIAHALGIITGVALVFVMVVGLYQGGDFYTTLLLAVAVGVSAVPEGLLSAVTVVLAFGARSIMNQGGLIKNLASAETLGSATYILTDKTGTLTFGEMKVENWLTKNEKDIEQLQIVSGLATDTFYDHASNKFVGDEMDTAINKQVYETVAQFDSAAEDHAVVDTIPFDSAYKFFATLRKTEKSFGVFIKGAPELLLEHAQYVLEKGKARTLSDKDKKYFTDLLQEQSSQGRRLLAVCMKENVPEVAFNSAWNNDGTATVPEGLVFCGLISFYDRVRESVPSVIAKMRESDTKVIMITGDNPTTAHRIALESGIITDEKEAVYTGQDIDSATDEHLLRVMQEGIIRVFARVTPDHKLRLASVLQDQGEVVAMTGDGVNDAPALQRATIGISLSSATEVAKEAADLVLVDNSFDTIAYAIAEGRRMISNLKKTVVYLLSTSFSEVLVLLGALIVSGPIPFYPTQILWANIIEEGLMNFGFLFEPDEKETHHEESGGLLGRHTRNIIVGIGVLNGLSLLAFYFGLIWWGIEGDLLRTYMFAALSVDSIFLGLALKSLYNPIWQVKLFSNMYLIVASIISFALLVVALITPFLRTILHLELLPVTGFAVIFVFGLVNLVMVEGVKKLCK